MVYVKPEAEILVFEDSNGFMTASSAGPAVDPYKATYGSSEQALQATCGSAYHAGNGNSGFTCSSFGGYGEHPPKGATVRIGNDEYYYNYETAGNSGKWKQR